VCLLVAGRGTGRREAHCAQLGDTAGPARGLPLLVWLTVETVRALCCCLTCLILNWDADGQAATVTMGGARQICTAEETQAMAAAVDSRLDVFCEWAMATAAGGVSKEVLSMTPWGCLRSVGAMGRSMKVRGNESSSLSFLSRSRIEKSNRDEWKECLPMGSSWLRGGGCSGSTAAVGAEGFLGDRA
jgi:hypothetical protein